MKMIFSNNNDGSKVVRNVFPLTMQKRESLDSGSPHDPKNLEKTMAISGMQSSMIGRLMNSRKCLGCNR